jgi:DNA-binding NarL/FixJ family response regulator
MTRIRVVLAHGDALCLAGLRALLERAGGVEVVGEAADGRRAVSLAQHLKPDLAVLEDALPKLNGVEVTARIAAAAPGVRVAILSDMADAPSVAAAFRAGAKGYLLKTTTPRALVAAVRDLMGGRIHLGAGVSRRLLRGGGAPRGKGPLTPRQRETLQMIAEGWSTKQIAQVLRISVKTVETHRAQLMARLEIYDVPGLVRYALKTKITRL